MYTLTHHARQRIRQRRLEVEWLLAALDGRCYYYASGLLLLCDPQSRCALVVDPVTRVVITAVRLKPKKFKRMFSREAARRQVAAPK